MPKFKNFPFRKLSSVSHGLKFEAVDDVSWSNATLNCSETLDEFEETVFELFSPKRDVNKKLH